MTVTVTWTAAHIEKMRTLWLSGVPASRIADQLGRNFTRNMVLGKLHRLGLSKKPPPERYSEEPPPRRNRPLLDRGTPSLAPIKRKP